MGFWFSQMPVQKSWTGGEVGSDLKYQIASELHVNVELSGHPRAFVTSLLKFKLACREGARQVLV